MTREPFELPDSECERATRDEMSAIRMLLIMASNLAYAKDDLKKRLGIVPDGEERLSSVLEEATSLFQDVLGTISDKQRRKLRNDANDYDVKLTPKFSADKTLMALSKQELTTLINCARERCKFCTLDGNECKKCELYQMLLTIVPLNDYGIGIMCPYVFQEWEE